MSLLTYDDARPWAASIRAKVAAREMPPWHVVRNVGIPKFKDDPSLSEDEIATIVAWVDTGAPRGNLPTCRPRVSSPAPTCGRSASPISSSLPGVHGAGRRPDVFPTLFAPLGITEDRYIKAIETRPVNGGVTAVVHHASRRWSAPAPTTARNADVEDGGAFMVEYASGKDRSCIRTTAACC